jgi:hypothetical protein
MVTIKTQLIRGKSDPNDDRPWYDLSVDNNQLIVDVDGDGGHKPDLSGKSIQIDTSEDSVVAVEQGDGLVTYPIGTDDVPPLRAHLAWYSADDDTLTLLEFVEP